MEEPLFLLILMPLFQALHLEKIQLILYTIKLVQKYNSDSKHVITKKKINQLKQYNKRPIMVELMHCLTAK